MHCYIEWSGGAAGCSASTPASSVSTPPEVVTPNIISQEKCYSFIYMFMWIFLAAPIIDGRSTSTCGPHYYVCTGLYIIMVPTLSFEWGCAGYRCKLFVLAEELSFSTCLPSFIYLIQLNGIDWKVIKRWLGTSKNKTFILINTEHRQLH